MSSTVTTGIGLVYEDIRAGDAAPVFDIELLDLSE